jgi:hypothetical protein
MSGRDPRRARRRRDPASARAFRVTLGALIVAACGSEPAPRAATRSSLLDTTGPSATEYATPAEWRYHPREPAQLFARLALSDGRTLLAGRHGERWLSDGRIAEAAAELAPEEIVAALPGKQGGFLFVGESGATYEARAPLGRFARSSTPPEFLTRVRAVGSSLIGLLRDGRLRRSDDAGASWSPVGPEGVRFQDVSVRPDGRGLALAVPEALWETRDFGLTFRRVDAATFGVETLEQDGAEIALGTPLGSRRWDPEGAAPGSGAAGRAGGRSDPRFVPVVRSAQPAVLALGAPPALGPTASALTEGHAVVVGGRWIEARRASGAGAWRLVTGPFGARLDAAPFVRVQGCAEVRLAGFGAILYLACARQPAGNITQPIEIQRSEDSGTTWKMEPYLAEGLSAELTMAVGASGDLVLSGLCPPAVRGPGCRPAGVHVRRAAQGDGGSGVALLPAATPSLAGSALGLLVSLDGRTTYALGRRSKGDAIAVFVSHDGGATFDPRDVEGLGIGAEDTRSLGRAVVESSATSEDGSVAFVVSNRTRRSWLVVDEDGRTISIGRSPDEAARIGAVGQRALAVNAKSREAWESFDAGASWAPLGRLPVDPCPPAGGCVLSVGCFAGGCVLGESVSRVGWREAPRTALLAPPAQQGNAGQVERRVGVTVSCTLDPGEWRRIVGATAPPTAHEAAIGKLAWLVPRRDLATASASVVHARAGSTTLDEVSLLAPTRRAESTAFAVASQVEGVAAIRYEIPGGARARDPALRHVEVSWDDALFGHVGHAVIPDGGAYRPGDFANGKSRAKLASPAMVSIASGGVYVRLHASLGDDQPTFFVDGHTTETAPPVRWPADPRRRARGEMIHVGRAHVPVWIDGTTVVRATREGGAWAFDAAGLGWTRPRDFGLEQLAGVAYAGERAGLLVLTLDTAESQGRGAVHPFRADGPVFDEPVPVPTQLDLPAIPRACSAADVLSTPRIVAPFEPGTRHAVLVTDPIEPMRVLLTRDAVLHGRPESACVAAYDASLVSSEVPGATQGEQAILPVSTLEHSWLFRQAESVRGAEPAIEYRTMSCRPDPGAEPPIEIFQEKGTLVERTP